MYFRSSWGSKDAAFSLFQCGPFYAGHQHADNNTFVIHRSGSLAIDSGTNDYGSHRGNYYSRTIAHNGILVFDPRESFAGTPWNSPGTPGSNDGGQMRGKGVTRVGQWRPGSPGDAGRIVKFINGKFVAACIGDATGSYRRQKVGRVVRAFYHLRGEAKNRTDTFVVFDRVETVRGKGPAKWIIHSIGKPAIDGDRFTITRAGGRLVGQVIWPEEVKFTLVGGPGRESFVNGRNYPPTGGKVDAEHGGWRIEFEFEKSAWVVLEAQAKGAALPPRVKVEGLDGSVGLRFRRGALQCGVQIGKPLHALPWV
ncbi:MAG: heparinase II/III family protein, partial [Planctomycetia bacterium]|nr:heparinase II/III family protein [Planctomycetia bacterium]